MAKAIAFLVLLLISPAVYAATQHVVGGAGGWTVATAGVGAGYGGWASGRNFAVGDTLLFNYDTTHAVYEVNQDEFNNCNDGDDDDDNPINVYSSSPTSILLSTPGTRYFICPRSNHCALGLKLAVTVSGGSTTPAGGAPPPTTTPSPTPVTPATPATPATPVTPVTPATPATPATPVTPYPPPPSTGVARNGTAHVVGGTKGWTTGVNYTSWASGQNFTTGDTLVFNYDAGSNAVYEVNQNDYNSCNNGDDDDDDDDDDHKPIHEYTASSPTIIPLSTVGTRYFICPRSNNCLQGQKLAVTVVMAGNTTRGGAPPTSGTNGTTISPTKPPAPAPMSPPPPPSGGAASIMGGRSGLVGGFSFALAALVGLIMG